MLKLAFTSVAFAGAACTSLTPPATVTRANATDRALAVLVQRGLPLPPRYKSHVELTAADVEAGAVRHWDVYCVDFALAGRTKPKEIYEVCLDARDGRVEYISDLRSGRRIQR